jgi:hypothetical protein
VSQTFTPPVVYDRPPYNVDSTDEQKALFKYFQNLNPRYVSVFLLSDGSFVQDTPNGFAPDGSEVSNTNCNIPYPWDPSNPSAPYVTAVYWDVSKSPAKYTVERTSHSVWIESVVNGVVEVTDTMAAALTAAGYGACLS